MSKISINLNRGTVLIFLFAISWVFYDMIQGFFIAILMAALISALLNGWYRRLMKWTGGRRSMASIITLLAFVLIILIPMSGFLALVVDQAVDAAKTLEPYLEGAKETPELALARYLETIPFVHRIFPEEQVLVENIHNLIQGLGNFVVDGLSKLTSGTVQFFFLTFIMLFTMYYFLIDGKEYLRKILYYIPLNNEQEALLLDKFVRVTKATLKGTLVIGAVQGSLGGVAMWIAGIPNTLFWGVIMAVLSIIPALGPAMVWIPASVILLLGGNYVGGIGLAIFGAVVIGNIDNLLRPALVGKDAKLPDLMILFGTLGGLALFGMTGIIIGPIVAALFMTAWEIYGQAFQDSLEKVTLFDLAKVTGKEPPAGGAPGGVEKPEP